MPRKTFVAGEILTAADVNTNLMDQSVMVFDDATARTTAIPTPVEGMVTYLKDANQVQAFTGSAFTPVGTILQVVTATHATQVNTTSLTFVTTGLSATITPSSASSKVMVFHTGSGGRDSNSGNNSVNFTLFRGSIASGTNLGDADEGLLNLFDDNTSGSRRLFGSLAMSVLDSPATASAVTYNVAMKIFTGVNAVAQRAGAPSSLTLMEVAG